VTTARIRWISGPVLRAVADGRFALREAVEVGPQRLLGEVVSLDGEELIVQVYEDTTGLKPGVAIAGTGQPLAIRVGPGLLGHMFDGLLRPLAATESPFISPGVAPVRSGTLAFRPTVRKGDRLARGAIFGEVTGSGGRVQNCLVPPDLEGEAISVAAPGDHAENATVLTLRDASGAGHGISMSHSWPVRVPRPVRSRAPGTRPLVTGQRILDCLFPIGQGGKAAIPGGFGTGKTVLLEALAKGCDADVIVYLGCGERGNEMAGVLEEFPGLTDPRTGRPLMERTVIIANTSNMPVAAREASIYSAATVAEYFRDQGLHVALMADSTSRWAEALREVSGRFGELPGESGYPAYLSSRLADFYERAAVVETLGGGSGSVTIMGAISPPSGDFSEPVTSHTKRYVKAFWALDVKRAQARFYPAINPLASYAEDAHAFAEWWAATGNPQWLALRRRFLTLLDEQARLERMARIIGKDALPLRQQLTLFCAELVNEAFLRQSALSPIDRAATPARQAAMMRLIGRYIDLADVAVSAGATLEALAALPCHRAVLRMSEEIGEEQMDRFAALAETVEREIGALAHAMETRDAAKTAG
jgi:V/A-type H+/Na+-transporting ATPase subunit A